jgi:hypothetical protein
VLASQLSKQCVCSMQSHSLCDREGHTGATYYVQMTRESGSTPTLLVTDSKGRINHVTSPLAKRLGSTTSKLQVCLRGHDQRAEGQRCPQQRKWMPAVHMQ